MRKIFVVLIVALMGLGMLKPTLGLSDSAYMTVFMLAMVGYCVCYLSWLKNTAAELGEIIPLLSSDPKRYIEETEKIKAKRRDGNIVSVLNMNIATAQCALGEFETAKKTLLAIRKGNLKGENGTIYFLNLAYVHLQLGEDEQAEKIFEHRQKKFLSLPMGGNLALMNCYIQAHQAIQKECWPEAQEIIVYGEETWGRDVPGMDFAPLLKKIEPHLAEIEQEQGQEQGQEIKVEE